MLIESGLSKFMGEKLVEHAGIKKAIKEEKIAANTKTKWTIVKEWNAWLCLTVNREHKADIIKNYGL